MLKTEFVKKKISLKDLNEYIEADRLFLVPLVLNQEAYIVVKGKPSMVVVTDISFYGVQLSGAWYTWDQIDKMGGVFNSQFDALSAVTQPSGS